MTASILDATTLGYLTGVLFAAVVVVLLVSLTIVLNILVQVGGRPQSHVGSIHDSLSAVAVSTDPVPATLVAINSSLGDLAGTLHDVEGHLAAARLLFDRVAEGA